jgi:HPt (histidine-containing phosphotransfer) domain-containing protein
MPHGPANRFNRNRTVTATYPAAGQGQSACSGEASTPSILDIAHLARMTFGDMGLQREVLGLFDRQVAMLLARMHGAPPTVTAALAHSIGGSARGVGAWEVAAAAEEFERAARQAGAHTVADALCALEGAIGAARSAIGELLAGSPAP